PARPRAPPRRTRTRRPARIRPPTRRPTPRPTSPPPTPRRRRRWPRPRATSPLSPIPTNMSCRIATASLAAGLCLGAVDVAHAAPSTEATQAGTNQALAPAMHAIDVDEHLGLVVDRDLR